MGDPPFHFEAYEKKPPDKSGGLAHTIVVSEVSAIRYK